VPDAWAHLADRYEQAYGPKRDSPCWPRAQALAARVNGPVLDIACGPGFDLSLFRDGVGIDSSPAMLASAKRRAPNARVVLGDMRSLPFLPHSFAAAFSCLALIHLTKADLASLLRELRTLLRPGAPVVAVFFAGEGERVTGFSPLNPRAVAQYAYYQAGELRVTFEDAGYRDVSIEDDILNEPERSGIPCLCVQASA
jgi:SAM-dependent methyltransferase